MRVHFQNGESVSSQFVRQVSDQVWAKSIRRTRPIRMKIVEPIREMSACARDERGVRDARE